jgi:hypothetical protein
MHRFLTILLGVVTLPLITLGIYSYIVIAIGAVIRLISLINNVAVAGTDADEMSVTASAALPIFAAILGYLLLLTMIAIIATRVGLSRFVLRFAATFLPSSLLIALIAHQSFDNIAYSFSFIIIVLWVFVFTRTIQKPKSN